MNYPDPPEYVPPPLVSLLEALENLLDQARTYEQILPAGNIPARAAVTVLGELARNALNEARALEEIFQTQTPARTQTQKEHPFSPREYQVLQLVARGLTNKEIAYRLALSERTIQFHVNSIFNKTGTGSRTEAVMVAVARQWIVVEAR